MTEDEAVQLVLENPKIAGWLDRYPPDPTTDADFDDDARTWTVKVWSGRAGQVGQAVVEDTTGQVVEAWTGPQVAWKMARGNEGMRYFISGRSALWTGAEACALYCVEA